MACAASTNSSVLRWFSLAASAGGAPLAAGLAWSCALTSPLWARGASDTDQECKPGDGEVAQNRILKLKHTSTHKFPDFVPARGQPGRGSVDAVQLGPQCGGNRSPNPMTDISDFVQQSHNFIALW